MISVGVDLVEIPRIKKSMINPRFCEKILGKDEFRQLRDRGFPVQSVAASFAAKEAFSKSIKTGFSGFKLNEVELLRKSNGAPYLKLSNGVLNLLDGNNYEFSVSVTHTDKYACAVVVCFCLNHIL